MPSSFFGEQDRNLFDFVVLPLQGWLVFETTSTVSSTVNYCVIACLERSIAYLCFQYLYFIETEILDVIVPLHMNRDKGDLDKKEPASSAGSRSIKDYCSSWYDLCVGLIIAVKIATKIVNTTATMIGKIQLTEEPPSRLVSTKPTISSKSIDQMSTIMYFMAMPPIVPIFQVITCMIIKVIISDVIVWKGHVKMTYV